MKVHEFRKNLKQAFDEALKGKAVLIERGGVQFKLVADVVTFRKPSDKQILEVQKALTEAKVPEVGRYVQTPEGIVGPTKLEPKAQKFCKNGHPIPEGRSKCLGKGCQYA